MVWAVIDSSSDADNHTCTVCVRRETRGEGGGACAAVQEAEGKVVPELRKHSNIAEKENIRNLM